MRGKAGWISTTAGSVLEFALRAGAFRPSVSLVWMQGYDGWGRAELRLRPARGGGGSGHSQVLDGRQGGGLRVTQAAMASLTVGPNSPWRLARNQDFVLSLRLLCDGGGRGARGMRCPKFKFMLVESC